MQYEPILKYNTRNTGIQQLRWIGLTLCACAEKDPAMTTTSLEKDNNCRLRDGCALLHSLLPVTSLSVAAHPLIARSPCIVPSEH